MNIKCRQILLLALALVCVLSSCNVSTSNTTSTTQADTTQNIPPKEPTPFPSYEDFDDSVGGLKRILESHGNTPLESLTENDFGFYHSQVAPRGKKPENVRVYNDLRWHLLLFGIENITMVDDNHVYVIYKLADEREMYVDDSEKSVYMYRMFVKETYVGDLSGETIEYWDSDETCEVYYFTNALSSVEFARRFDVGDTMEQAIAVAPWLEFDIDNRYDCQNYCAPKPEVPTQTCFQLLEDGVLVLRFEANCTTDEWEAQGKPNSALICTDMEFYPNGTPATVDGIELTVLTAPANKRPPLPKGE